MRHIKNALLALLVGCFVPIIIWVAGGIALYQASYQNQKRKIKKLAGNVLTGLTCSIDADCPPGHICMNGQCVPESMG